MMSEMKKAAQHSKSAPDQLAIEIAKIAEGLSTEHPCSTYHANMTVLRQVSLVVLPVMNQTIDYGNFSKQIQVWCCEWGTVQRTPTIRFLPMLLVEDLTLNYLVGRHY